MEDIIASKKNIFFFLPLENINKHQIYLTPAKIYTQHIFTNAL